MGTLNVDKVSFSSVSQVDAFALSAETSKKSLFLRRGPSTSDEGLIVHVQGDGEDRYNENEVYFHKRVHFIDGIDFGTGGIDVSVFAPQSISADKLANWTKPDVERIIPDYSINLTKLAQYTADGNILDVNISGNARSASYLLTKDGKLVSINDLVLKTEIDDTVMQSVNKAVSNFVSSSSLAETLENYFYVNPQGQNVIGGDGLVVPSILRVARYSNDKRTSATEKATGGKLWLQNSEYNDKFNSVIYNYHSTGVSGDSRMIIGGENASTVGKLEDNGIGNSVGSSIVVWHEKSLVDINADQLKLNGSSGTLTITPTGLTTSADSFTINNKLNVKGLTVNGKDLTNLDPAKTATFDSSSVGSATNPVYLSNGKIVAGSATLSIAAAIAGNRGNLAGYSNAPQSISANANIDFNSRDDIILNGSGSYTVRIITSTSGGKCWCKTISINNPSAVIAFEEGKWYNEENKNIGTNPPSYEKYSVLTLYWNGTFGKIFAG